MTRHPGEGDLALLAGGETGRARRFWLDRHVRDCADCQSRVAEFHALRSDLADSELPEVNWNFLAADMSANIRLGLEAGACVRETQVSRNWNPRLTLAFASLLILAGSGLAVHDSRPLLHRQGVAAAISATPVLESSRSGVEFRTGANSLMLLNHHGNPSNQTVSAQGDIGAHYIDGETGSVIINNVYLQ
jgi:hypothetical protein